MHIRPGSKPKARDSVGGQAWPALVPAGASELLARANLTDNAAISAVLVLFVRLDVAPLPLSRRY